MQNLTDIQPARANIRLNTALIVATFIIGLFVDQIGGIVGQLVVSVWTWALMLQVIATSPRRWRLPLYACLVWATAGEVFLSLVWGVYTYRLENVPFFIPPGHVLLFWLGLVHSARVSHAFIAIVPLTTIVYAVYSFSTGFDTLSIPLIGLFLLGWLQPEGRKLYSLMLVLALMLELYGTWMGNWAWRAEVPFMGLSSNNPPYAAGSFYCMLDVLVGLTVRLILSRAGGSKEDLDQAARQVINPGRRNM